jgi:hypothetical protein
MIIEPLLKFHNGTDISARSNGRREVITSDAIVNFHPPP